jgi:hypothetical protein
MQVGDLVIVKEGCGDEGKVGVILNTTRSTALSIASASVLFPDGVKHLNAWWLEPLEAADAKG